MLCNGLILKIVLIKFFCREWIEKVARFDHRSSKRAFLKGVGGIFCKKSLS